FVLAYLLAPEAAKAVADAGVVDDVDIHTDIDRNGTVEFTGVDEDNDETDGTVVIADKTGEGVYQDPTEPAKLREVVIRNLTANRVVWVHRSSAKVKLYDVANPAEDAKDLLETANAAEIQLMPKSYYLKGGADPSTGVRDQFRE